jgi:tricorn protease
MGGVIGFIRGFYSQADKQAMILDERYNGGGMIPTFFIEKLTKRSVTAMRARNSKDIAFPTQYLEGPKVMLINQYAGSGGDMLPWLFKEAGLGPLIGQRTWGGLVGLSGSAPLIDGGFLSAPGFGIFDRLKGERIAENKGVDPDIDVDLRPDLLAKGQDPQLERAVEYLLNELKKPRREYKRPDFPTVKP